MNAIYLAIEKDIDFHEKESEFWLSRGVSSIRVSSMSEGIKEVGNHQFLYIGINADNINYKHQLPLLREATNDPLFISSTTYTMQEQGIAIKLGADLFGQIGETSKDNFDTVMANIEGLQERSKRRKSPVCLIHYGNILIAPKHHHVFVDDMSVQLTKSDLDLLCFFMNNRGQVLNATQIYNHLWKNDHAEIIEDFVRSAIKRLRKKLGGQNNDNFLIETIREVGYRLPVIFVK